MICVRHAPCAGGCRRMLARRCAALLFAAPGAVAPTFPAETALTEQALVDGPSTGVARQVASYRDVSLTPYVVHKLPRAAGTKVVRKYFDESGVADKWAASKWAKTLKARELRRNTTDCA